MNIISENELPDDIGQLKSMILDLNRRLQNTHYILQSERLMKDQLFQQNEFYKFQLKQLLQYFALEFSRMKSFEWKTIQEHESVAYEQKKIDHTKNLEALRLLELDNQIAGRKKFVPKNILKLRSSVVEMEKQQENQRKFLSYLSKFQQLNERLLTAIQQNMLADVLESLQQGAEVNYIDNIGYLPLHYAVIYGHYDICQVLLMKGADLSTYLTGFSSLVFAAQYGHVSILSLLLSFGGNILEKDRNGISAVMMALMHYHYQVMEFCVLHGADLMDYDLSTENTLLHTIVLISSPSYQANLPYSETMPTPATGLRRGKRSSQSLPPPPSEQTGHDLVVEQIVRFLVEHGSRELLERRNKQHLTAFELALTLQNRLCIDLLKPFYESNLNVSRPSVSGYPGLKTSAFTEMSPLEAKEASESMSQYQSRTSGHRLSEEREVTKTSLDVFSVASSVTFD